MPSAQPAVDKEFGRLNPKIAGVALASQIGLLAGAAYLGVHRRRSSAGSWHLTRVFSSAPRSSLSLGMPDYSIFLRLCKLHNEREHLAFRESGGRTDSSQCSGLRSTRLRRAELRSRCHQPAGIPPRHAYLASDIHVHLVGCWRTRSPGFWPRLS